MTATVTTSKVIDLAQLAGEMAGASLTLRSSGGQSTVSGEVEQAALDAAVSAHVAPDYTARAANETTIKDRATTALADNKTFLAIAAPTNAQNAAQVKALTRQVNGLIRMVLRRFESAD